MSEPTEATALMAMLRGVVGERIGYLILADWIDEHLHRTDLAEVLRRTVPGPPPAFEGEVSFSMRYDALDEMTMLFLGRYVVNGQPAGHVVCLGTRDTRAARGAPLVRWLRWLPESGPEAAALWDRASETKS